MGVMKKLKVRHSIKRKIITIASAIAFSCILPSSESIFNIRKINALPRTASYIPKHLRKDKTDPSLRAVVFMTFLLSKNPNQRKDAVIRLGKITKANPKLPKIKEILTHLVISLDDKNKDVRKAAVYSLSKIGNAAIPALIEHLEYSSVRTRRNIIITLRNINDVNSIPLLINLTLKEKNNSVAWEAYRAVLDIIEKNNDKKYFSIFVPGLLKVLKTNNGYRAQIIIAKIGAPAIPELDKAMKSRDYDFRLKIIYVFEKMGHVAIPSLIKAFKDKHWHVRLKSVKVLGELGDKSILPILEKVSRRDREEIVREEAKNAIKKIKEREKNQFNPRMIRSGKAKMT
jgi:HEAT repeat protein